MSNVLKELIKAEEDAVEFGCEWPNEEYIFEQVISECNEVKSAIQDNEGKDRIQEEIGDLLHTSISLCRFAGFDIEETLTKTVKKFTNRIQALKEITRLKGLDSLQGQSSKFILELWSEAKKRDK